MTDERIIELWQSTHPGATKQTFPTIHDFAFARALLAAERARPREILSRHLNLHYQQRAYSWHEIQDALDEIEGRK